MLHITSPVHFNQKTYYLFVFSRHNEVDENNLRALNDGVLIDQSIRYKATVNAFRPALDRFAINFLSFNLA